MSFHDASVAAYLQILNSLTGILGKAEAYCTAKKIQPEVLLGARLYPDMLPLSRQIQLTCDFATKGCARLTPSARHVRRRADIRLRPVRRETHGASRRRPNSIRS